MRAVLYYVHDPMCSWCWGFKRTWDAVKTQLPEQLELIYLVGGLAADSDQPMQPDLQAHLPKVWQSIQERIPHTEFNYDFWELCQPRRSTYPACRAVLAAKAIDSRKEVEMIEGIQKAYYLQAQNPSDIDTLSSVAKSIGLNGDEFIRQIKSAEINAQLLSNIEFARSIGGAGFPSLFLEISSKSNGKVINPINIDYNSPEKILSQIQLYLK